MIVNRHGIAIRPLADGIPRRILAAVPHVRPPVTNALLATLAAHFSAAGQAIL